MLVCATLFWAGNFMIGKLAFLSNIPPMTLVFFRWSLVWLILLPFTYNEIVRNKKIIQENLPFLFAALIAKHIRTKTLVLIISVLFIL